MSLAEMTRIKVPRRVKTTESRRPSSVLPSAANRGSRRECTASGATTSGRLKKLSSTSPRLTSCSSQFFSAFPSSHSNPVESASSSGNPATHCILPAYTARATSPARLAACCIGGQAATARREAAARARGTWLSASQYGVEAGRHRADEHHRRHHHHRDESITPLAPRIATATVTEAPMSVRRLVRGFRVGREPLFRLRVDMGGLGRW